MEKMEWAKFMHDNDDHINSVSVNTTERAHDVKLFTCGSVFDSFSITITKATSETHKKNEIKEKDANNTYRSGSGSSSNDS